MRCVGLPASSGANPAYSFAQPTEYQRRFLRRPCTERCASEPRKRASGMRPGLECSAKRPRGSEASKERQRAVGAFSRTADASSKSSAAHRPSHLNSYNPVAAKSHTANRQESNHGIGICSARH